MMSMALICSYGEHREAMDWPYRAARLNHAPARDKLFEYNYMFGSIENVITMMNPLYNGGSTLK